MEFFENFVNWVYDENPNNSKLKKSKITQDKCEFCHNRCHKRCECRCHVPSCRSCDDKNCEFKYCSCRCHIMKTPPIIIAIENHTNTIETNLMPEVNVNITGEATASVGELLVPAISPSNVPKVPVRNKDLLERYIKNKALKSLSNNEPDMNPVSASDSNLNDSQLSSQRYSNTKQEIKTSPLIKFKSFVGKIEKNKLVNKLTKKVGDEPGNHSNSNIKNPFGSGLANNSSFKLSKNPLIFNNTIKKRIEGIKFKDLEDSPQVKSFDANVTAGNNNNYYNYHGNSNTSEVMMSPTKTNNNASFDNTFATPSLSPIAPSRKNTKDHLNYSFDLNNSKLYHGKSLVVKKMEDIKVELEARKQNDKDYQVKKVLKGLETQDAWQMYNSLIFANPADLPDAKDLKIIQEKKINYSVEKNKMKAAGIVITTSKKK